MRRWSCTLQATSHNWIQYSEIHLRGENMCPVYKKQPLALYRLLMATWSAGVRPLQATAWDATRRCVASRRIGPDMNHYWRRGRTLLQAEARSVPELHGPSNLQGHGGLDYMDMSVDDFDALGRHADQHENGQACFFVCLFICLFVCLFLAMIAVKHCIYDHGGAQPQVRSAAVLNC